MSIRCNNDQIQGTYTTGSNHQFYNQQVYNQQIYPLLLNPNNTFNASQEPMGNVYVMSTMSGPTKMTDSQSVGTTAINIPSIAKATSEQVKYYAYIPVSSPYISLSSYTPQLPPTPSSVPRITYNLDLYDIPSRLFCYACSKLGSEYISHRIKDPVYFNLFFKKLSKFFPSLMVNRVGHKLCRDFYCQPHCSLVQKLDLLNSLVPEFSKIASNRQGSFAIICIMNLMTTTQEIQVLTNAFIAAINTKKGNENAFDDIIFSQSGYHLIQKFICFGDTNFDCILQGLSKNFTKYATHHYGVPIIRAILNMISDNNLVNKYQVILKLLVKDTDLLICNEYGNYVIQQLLQISPKNVTDKIKQLMLTKYSKYSKHKFASNVVEKCLKHSLNEIKNVNHNDIDNDNGNYWIVVIVRELLFDASELINHKIGNYCLQTALSVVMELCADNNNNNYNNDYIWLLNEFINTAYPLLNLLKHNVKRKWHQLLISAKAQNKFYH